MGELTKAQLDRQDAVDNEIFNLLCSLNPSEKDVEWDMEIIGEIRELIVEYFEEKNICSEQEFYPYVEEK